VHLIKSAEANEITDASKFSKAFSEEGRNAKWLNIGGQLMSEKDVEVLKEQIKNQTINSWDELHEAYYNEGKIYPFKKAQHALASLLEIENIQAENISDKKIIEWLDKAVLINESITKRIIQSRKKDYTNPFRKMVYSSEEEMNNVTGSFNSNSFIKQKQEELESFRQLVQKLKMKFRV
jgi:hypothetical protein